jgi:hypothetical protein
MDPSLQILGGHFRYRNFDVLLYCCMYLFYCIPHSFLGIDAIFSTFCRFTNLKQFRDFLWPVDVSNNYYFLFICFSSWYVLSYLITKYRIDLVLQSLGNLAVALSRSIIITTNFRNKGKVNYF